MIENINISRTREKVKSATYERNILHLSKILENIFTHLKCFLEETDK